MGGVETPTADGFGWYTRSACLYHQLAPSHISGNFQSRSLLSLIMCCLVTVRGYGSIDHPDSPLNTVRVASVPSHTRIYGNSDQFLSAPI